MSRRLIDADPDKNALHAQRASQGKESFWAFDRSTALMDADQWPEKALVPLATTDHRGAD